MCGIVGIVAASPIDAATVERMRDRLAHRGPDHAGSWRSADGRICLGHRRLAIIDLDERSNQPLQSHDARFTVTFNGEIYNYREIRVRLERLGARFHTQSDTEVLLEAYRAWGAESLQQLSGMFAFAIWDARERRLFCARDRAGEKPFYYAVVGDAFLFASEVKGLLDWPALPRRLDYEALIDYLTLGFVADPKSIWVDVRKLPPAHSMTVELPVDASPMVRSPRRYWSLQFGAAKGTDGADRIRSTLLAAAQEMVVSDVPVGTFLSGGVDSSAVTAALSLSGQRVRSFTVGFDLPQYDERRWARQVAERYHTEHTERTVEPDDVLALLDRLNWHYDEPFSDYSSFPTFYLCREARRSITVALSGDGADELFAGYRKYQRLARRAELRGVFPVPVARAVSAVARQTLEEGHHWRRTLTQYGLDAPAMLADMLCNNFPLPLLQSVARGPLARTLQDYNPAQLIQGLLADAPPSRVGLLDAMRHLDFALTLPGDMLVKVDRASMAVALEVRPLFLHRNVMELAASIPPSGLADRHAAKIALREAVRPWLPDALIDRRKQGFAMPLPEWLGTDLGATMRADQACKAMHEVLDVGRIAQLQAAHARGRGNFASIVHATFALNHWFGRWMT
jgi:asparagine synthase (glutamine-hydrolysing)